MRCRDFFSGKTVFLHQMAVFLYVCLCLSVFSGCATTYVDEPKTSEVKPEGSLKAVQHAYAGPKTVVAVLPMGLSEKAAKRYPHLLAKDVGMGIHNMLVESLYDTGRFTFVEEKPEIIKDVMDRQWMSSAGMVDQGAAVQLGKMLGAKKVIYGEVYDYAEGGESVVGFSAKQNFRTRMGVQVRCVDVETLEYVPGSGVEYGSDVTGTASKAIETAVNVLIKRLK